MPANAICPNCTTKWAVGTDAQGQINPTKCGFCSSAFLVAWSPTPVLATATQSQPAGHVPQVKLTCPRCSTSRVGPDPRKSITEQPDWVEFVDRHRKTTCGYDLNWTPFVELGSDFSPKPAKPRLTEVQEGGKRFYALRSVP